MKKSLNKKNILSNIQEAKHELESLEKAIKLSKKLTETDLEISLRHTYHHLNFSWNTRHVNAQDYKNLSDRDFEKWGLFPDGMDSLIMKR